MFYCVLNDHWLFCDNVIYTCKSGAGVRAGVKGAVLLPLKCDSN